MSRDGSTILTFLDGEEYQFRLAWGQLIKLQEARLCGPFVVLGRLFDDTWKVADISEVIRLGLVGGGLGEVVARKLVRGHVETQPPMVSLPLARDIFLAAVNGPPDEEAIEKKAVAAIRWTTCRMAASASPRSMVSLH